jgi:hypothetical protein
MVRRRVVPVAGAAPSSWSPTRRDEGDPAHGLLKRGARRRAAKGDGMPPLFATPKRDAATTEMLSAGASVCAFVRPRSIAGLGAHRQGAAKLARKWTRTTCRRVRRLTWPPPPAAVRRTPAEQGATPTPGVEGEQTPLVCAAAEVASQRFAPRPLG